jgi:hypothetical protein
MALLPRGAVADDRGSPWAAAFLGLVGLLNIATGCIHYLLPDGGAGVIAGLTLGADRAVVIGTFAWMGAAQIAHGLAELAVAGRYRALVPLFLSLALLEDMLAAVSAWVTKRSPTGHHPPENFAVLVMIPLAAVFLALSLRPRR